MNLRSKEALVSFIWGVKDSAVVAGVLLLLVAVGVLGMSVVYCWHEIVLKGYHWVHR